MAKQTEMSQIPANLPEANLKDVARLLASGQLAVTTYADAVLSSANHQRALNAFTGLDPDQLMAAAERADSALRNGERTGDLIGIPLIFKDNINTAALPTTAGTPALQGNMPAADAPVAAVLFAAGALLAGKANLHELSSGGTSNNHVFGTVANPYALDRVPGGSSGGTAAAVAARLVPGGLGTDTAGSVRVPAALCGIVGLRPTIGRYPSDGIVPLSSSFDTAGPMARTVEDVALLDGAITGEGTPPQGLPPEQLRLGVPYDSLVAAAEPTVATVFEQTLRLLETAGVSLVAIDLAHIRDLTSAAAAAVIDYEFPDVMGAYLKTYAPGISLETLAERVASPAARKLTLERLAKTRDPADYQDAQNRRLPLLRQAHHALFRETAIDALLFPTTPDVALPHGGDDNVLRNGETLFSWFYFSHTSLASIAGNPSLTLPGGLSSEGLPVGLSLDGLPGGDRRLLSAALTVERLVGRLPPPAPPI